MAGPEAGKSGGSIRGGIKKADFYLNRTYE